MHRPQQRASRRAELANANHRISSFDQKPASGGIPAIADRRDRERPNVTGIFFASPPILRMSCSPESAWITLPAPRNRQALKNACVTTWKMADAVGAHAQRRRT